MEKNIETDGVKSTAVVKYSVPKPAQFMKLKCNTDLNLPPANWLSSSVDPYGLQHLLYQPKGFSRMSQSFLDCIGTVDVVSDAENIKNLLKIPYHKGLISMMVHRIDNTLLLDEFDIYKHILLQAKTEWKWFKKFFHENVDENVTEYERHLYIKNKTRKALKQKSLVSKFLYHSLVQNEGDLLEHQPSLATTLPVTGPLLPNPSPTTEVPDPSSFDHTYNRNVVWTFEDIEMLIGTDMPIFGGGTHPCISLRLNDMSKPINVLTGIDYWLDNLMSNVPEVVMCYHLNGIVQKYELIKTEELPRLENSKFSPKLIRDVAQSILSFLKSNTTKAGHTYWLFKGKDEDVVKLYDLTSLCSEVDVKNDQNPFTVPVAMLLYRVARNMKNSTDRNRPGTIRLLLKNCIKLLAQDKYPEIITSSHYMLSDLYIPSTINPDNPILDNSDCEETESIYDDDEDLNEEDDKHETTTKFLYLDSDHYYESCRKYNKRPPPIVGTVEDRCIQAIYHVCEGINFLQYFQEDNEKEKRRQEEENIPMAKPFEPIPMPYEKLSKSSSVEFNDEEESARNKKKNKKQKNKNKKKSEDNDANKDTINALLLKEKGEAVPTWQEQNLPEISWKQHLKSLLYQKAILVYATLAENHYTTKNYGNSLRCLGILARCLQIFKTFTNKVYSSLEESCLLGRAGDCCIMMVQNWDNVEINQTQFHSQLDEDLKMIEQLEKDEQLYNISIGECTMKCVLIYDIRTIEQMLLQGVECYEKALKCGDSDSILRRLGNSYNEVGTFYLHRGKNGVSASITIDCCRKAEIYFKKGLEVFEQVKDDANMALLCTNVGHLHRLLAHINTPSERGELTMKERLHYNKACLNYKKALQVLGERKHNTAVWDAVNWELCTTLFNMATILHDNPAPEMDKLDAGKEIIETLQKSLQYCDLNEENSRFPLYQFRAASIHFKLGAIYHHHIFEGFYMSDANKRHMIQLSKTNYDKGADLYFALNDGLNYFVSKMQKMALVELGGETATASHLKLKHFQSCLNILLQLPCMLSLIIEKKVEIPDEEVAKFNIKSKEETFSKSYGTILLLIKNRLQHILKTLIKLCMIKPPINKDCLKLVERYKLSYTSSFILEDCTDFYNFVSKLNKVLLGIGVNLKNL